MSTSAVPVEILADPGRAATVLNPLRQRLLAELARPDSATGLARRLGLKRQQLNYHLRQLERDGLVEVVEERKKRNCTERIVRAVARSYLIAPSALGGLAADPSHVTDHASSAYLVAVAARLIREVAEMREAAHAAGKKLPTLTLQSDVRFASAERQHAFAEELSRTLAHLIAKYHDEEAPRGRPFRVMVGAHPAPADGANVEDA